MIAENSAIEAAVFAVSIAARFLKLFAPEGGRPRPCALRGAAGAGRKSFVGSLTAR